MLLRRCICTTLQCAYGWYNMRILTIVKCFRRLLQQVGPVGVGDSLIEERTSLVQSTSFTMIFYYNKLTSFTMIFFYNKSITSSIIFFILLPSSGAVSPFYNNRSPNQSTIQVYKRPMNNRPSGVNHPYPNNKQTNRAVSYVRLNKHPTQTFIYPCYFMYSLKCLPFESF